MNAINHFRNRNALAGYAASKNVPQPKVAVVGSGVIALLGGLGIVTGLYSHLAVILVIIFLAPITFMMHAFWKSPTPEARMNEHVNFFKNLALIGAALAFLAVPEPWMLSL